MPILVSSDTAEGVFELLSKARELASGQSVAALNAEADPSEADYFACGADTLYRVKEGTTNLDAEAWAEVQQRLTSRGRRGAARP